MASETNIVQRHRPRLFTSYTFGWFPSGTGGDFSVDTLKEEFGCLECFSPLPTHRVRHEGLIHLSKPKKGVGWRKNNSFGVQEGSNDLYLQRGVRQGLRIVHKAQWKVRSNRLGPSEEKLSNELPSISLSFIFWRIQVLFGFSWNSPHMYVCRKTKVSLLSFIVRKNIPVQELVTKLLQALLYYST